jgi:agmatinase
MGRMPGCAFLNSQFVQIDAHLDFVDTRQGVREGHGNPMRRAVEQSHVTGLT